MNVGVKCCLETCGKWMHMCEVTCRVRLFETLWTEACLAPLSVEFSRQEYWSQLPFPPPEDLPNLGIKHMSLH